MTADDVLANHDGVSEASRELLICALDAMRSALCFVNSESEVAHKLHSAIFLIEKRLGER